MEIKITYGVGEGPTELSAFDRALFDAGIANYNLLELSSVIPEGAEIKVGKINWNQKEYGYRLYVVMSRHSEKAVGKEAWAGLGWLQDKTGKGLFVEHVGSSENEIKELVENSLKRMQEYRKEKFGKINYKAAGIKCKGKPVCAIVSAVYKSEGWQND